jgi:hypothetical protein
MNPWQVFGDVLPGLGRILLRVYGRDVWPYRPLFQHSRDSAKHVPRRRKPHHHARHTVLRGLFLRYGLDGGHKMAAFLQDEVRPILCIATDQVEDHIDLLSQNLLELRLAIINNPARSEGVEVRLIVAACRGNDGGTGMLCQLHRIGTHTAHFVTGVRVGRLMIIAAHVVHLKVHLRWCIHTPAKSLYSSTSRRERDKIKPTAKH